MPPDQLNPAGYIDGQLTSFMPNQGRAKSKKGLKSSGGVLGYDPRAAYLPFPDPTPGDPNRWESTKVLSCPLVPLVGSLKSLSSRSETSLAC